MQHKLFNKAEVRTEFATALRRWRGQLGLSQEQLAERAGLHRTYISDVERGARNLSLESISKLAMALDISVSTLFPSPESQHDLSSNLFPKECVDVLLVEDDPNDVEFTLLAFRKARFANIVHVVHDGVEALDYLFRRGIHSQRRHEDRPQVILLDLNMPKMGGLEVLRRLKEEKKTRMIPVIILTVSQKDRDIDECLRLGAEIYIVKPVDFQRLSQVTPALNLNWALFKPQAALTA